MNTKRKKSHSRNALIILAATLILAAVFHLELGDLAARYLPESRSRSATGTDAPQSQAVAQPASPDIPARGLSASGLHQPETDLWLTAKGGEVLPAPAAAPAERLVSLQTPIESQAASTEQPKQSPSAADPPAPEPASSSTPPQRESEATAAVRVALALQDAGESVAAHDRLRSVVKEYPGTSAARLAERVLQAADTGVARQTSDLLERAAEEQAAGRWAQARHFLELAATKYRGTAAADEAAKQLKVVAEEEWKLREGEAAGYLREAVGLQEQGESSKAQRSFEWITTNYRHTAAADEAVQRLAVLAQDAEGRRKQIAVDMLRQAVSLHESGDLAEAQRLLEWIVATYSDSATANEASKRLNELLQGERQQRGQAAQRMLRQAVALQEGGKLIEARRLLFQIVSTHRQSPQYEEAVRRQRQVEQALSEQEAGEELRRAAQMREEGRTDQARWLLEQIVRKYRRTPLAKEAATHLEQLARQQP